MEEKNVLGNRTGEIMLRVVENRIGEIILHVVGKRPGEIICCREMNF